MTVQVSIGHGLRLAGDGACVWLPFGLVFESLMNQHMRQSGQEQETQPAMFTQFRESLKPATSAF
jgi:hypothetical protein